VSESVLDKFKTKGAGYEVRDGKRIERGELVRKTPARKKRKPFKTDLILLPTAWTTCLSRAKRAATHNLAHWILEEAFKRKHVGGDVVLSTEATGMPRSTRWRAIKELVALGLINIEQRGHKAPRIAKLLNLPRDWDHAPAAIL
jgi:hypothetical protein